MTDCGFHHSMSSQGVPAVLDIRLWSQVVSVPGQGVGQIMIGIFDLLFFSCWIFLIFGAIYFHWATAQHGKIRKGSVGSNYWGTYEDTAKVKSQGSFKLPKPSSVLSSTTIGKQPPGSGARR